MLRSNPPKFAGSKKTGRAPAPYDPSMKYIVIALLLTFASVPVHAEASETVAITYHVKDENESALLKAIQKHWSVTRRLGLVEGAHALYRGNGFFLEILTWKDASTPDNAPPEVRAIWADMERLVDRSAGKKALDIQEVQPVAAKE
jgi:hypothetical protein